MLDKLKIHDIIRVGGDFYVKIYVKFKIKKIKF